MLWCLTMVWLPTLLAAEVLQARLRYTVRRWSTVFPVGMYAACSFVVGTVTATPGMTDFARVRVALAVWLIVFADAPPRSEPRRRSAMSREPRFRPGSRTRPRPRRRDQW